MTKINFNGQKLNFQTALEVNSKKNKQSKLIYVSKTFSLTKINKMFLCLYSRIFAL